MSASQYLFAGLDFTLTHTPTPWEQACADAKQLLREHLRLHPDEGIRMLNEICEPADDDPSVLAIAQVLTSQRNAAA